MSCQRNNIVAAKQQVTVVVIKQCAAALGAPLVFGHSEGDCHLILAQSKSLGVGGGGEQEDAEP